MPNDVASWQPAPHSLLLSWVHFTLQYQHWFIWLEICLLYLEDLYFLEQLLGIYARTLLLILSPKQMSEQVL